MQMLNVTQCLNNNAAIIECENVTRFLSMRSEMTIANPGALGHVTRYNYRLALKQYNNRPAFLLRLYHISHHA